jgi:hypothetical protein
MDVEAVRGAGYVYFDGLDGFDKINSIMAHPVFSTTDDITRLAIEQIESSLQ